MLPNLRKSGLVGSILTYLLTYLLILLTQLLTPWMRVLLEKPIGLQPVKEFSTFFET